MLLTAAAFYLVLMERKGGEAFIFFCVQVLTIVIVCGCEKTWIAGREIRDFPLRS